MVIAVSARVTLVVQGRERRPVRRLAGLLKQRFVRVFHGPAGRVLGVGSEAGSVRRGSRGMGRGVWGVGVGLDAEEVAVELAQLGLPREDLCVRAHHQAGHREVTIAIVDLDRAAFLA